MYTLHILYYVHSFFHGVNAGFQHRPMDFLLGPTTDRRHFQTDLRTSQQETRCHTAPRVRWRLSRSPTHAPGPRVIGHCFVHKLLDSPLPSPQCGFVIRFALVLLTETGLWFPLLCYLLIYQCYPPFGKGMWAVPLLSMAWDSLCSLGASWRHFEK